MAGENVIRRDVVQIGFDVQDNPIRNLLNTLNDVRSNATRVTSSADDATREISQMGDELNQAARNADNLGRSDIDDLRADILSANRTTQNLQDSMRELTGAIRDAAQSTDDVRNGADEAGNSLENCTKIADGLKGALAAAAGAFGVSQVVGGVAEMQSSLNKFQAQTGVSTIEMEGYGDAIKSLYGDAMGESLEDVSNSMATVMQTTGLVGKELEGTTRNALLMRDTFDFDVQESVRSVDMMMKQFGVSSEEAYSMIAQGAQNGLNKNGDLLDTVNEYSVHFKQLGFSSEDMFNMLVNGAKSGTFSVDKLGDAVKEFGVRVVDGSDTTSEGFSAIGLDADEMAKKFKSGGESGKQAFSDTIEALKAMEDPVAREAAGVALFGTMWEDLGAEGVFALSNVTGEVTKSTDALNKINEVRYNDIGSALEALKRKGILALNTAMTPVLNKVITLINKFQEWAAKVGLVDKIKAAFDRVKTAVEPIFNAIGNVIGKIYEFVTAESTINAIKSAFDRVKSVVEPIIGIVKSVIDEIIGFATAEATVNTVKGAFNKVREVLDKIFEVASNVFNFIKENIDVILPLVEGLVIAWGAYKTIMLIITGVQKAYAAVQWAVNAAMNANPVGIIITAIGLLIGVIILLVKNWDKVKEVAAKVWGKIKAIWGTVKTWFMTNVITPIVKFFTGLWTKLKTIFNSIKNSITTVFSTVAMWVYNNVITPVVTFVTGLWTSIVNIVTEIWNSIVSIFSTVATWVYDNVISPIVNFFSGLWTSITEIFSNVVSWFSEKFSAAVEAIKSVFGTVVEFFTGIWDNIKSIFTEIGTTIGNGIAEAFATVVNAVIDFAESTINGFIRAINAAIGLINEIPGVEISTISELSIPRLAKGAIVDKPTIAQIGEDGREAVVPLENNLGWIRRIADSVTAAITSPNTKGSYEKEAPITSKSEHNEYNEYKPTFVINLNGASATDDNKRKVKRWIREAMKEMFDDLDRDNEPIIEV